MRLNEKNIKKIFSVNSGFCEVGDMLSNAKDALLNSDDELFNSYLKDALIKAEKSYIRLRKYISDTVESPYVKEEILQKEVNNSKIKISKLGNGIIKITMPIILPFKKLKSIHAYPNEYTHIEFTDTIDRVNCFTSLLEKALDDFKKENNLSSIHMQNFTILYKNIFAKENLNSIPDSDNYEYKQITDIIVNAFAHGNDGFNNVDFIYNSCLGESTHTDVYLIPNRCFTDCLSKFLEEKESKIIKFPKSENIDFDKSA